MTNRNTPYAVFRFDISDRLGGGHLMRCLTLAREFGSRGWQITLAVNHEGRAYCENLVGDGIHTVYLPAGASRDGMALSHAIDGGCDRLIIDHYELDASYHDALRGWASRICAITDLAERPMACDTLIDPSPGRIAEDYAPFVGADCRLFLGPTYALLRPEFPAARRSALERRGRHKLAERLLISFGLTDPGNHTAAALDAAVSCKLPVKIDIVLGPNAPHLDEIRRRVAKLKESVVLHENPGKMADLMTRADIAVGAAGGSSLERCCLGLPTVTLAVADNQVHYLKKLADLGAVFPVGTDRGAATPNGPGLSDRVADALTTLWQSPDKRAQISSRASELCDGRGAQRAAAELIGLQNVV